MQTHGLDYSQLAERIRTWGQELGFQQIGFANIDLADAENWLNQWIEKGFHGEMGYMERHGSKRTRPECLVEGTVSVISARMNYLPEEREAMTTRLEESTQAYISRYSLGRDYHKLMRQRLQMLADKITSAIGPFGFRVFTDSAPVMEKALAEKAGLGWIGKHTNLINKEAGSFFFLGEIYTDLPLPLDHSADNHCGSCKACIDCCPTGAIVSPYQLDARRCISYLTIELKGAIPLEFRSAIGNRIYGCDDCQLVCPWNRYSSLTEELDFLPRHQLDRASLAEVFLWDAETFFNKTEGSAIRRIGYEAWVRNIAIALGNDIPSEECMQLLSTRLEDTSALIREHVLWAYEKQRQGLLGHNGQDT